jgi:hypothetical protein
VLEETGVAIQLVSESLNAVDLPGQPKQLCRPIGIQLEDIRAGHQHIDLVYVAISAGGNPSAGAHWFDEHRLKTLELSDEVRTWCEVAISMVDRQAP